MIGLLLLALIVCIGVLVWGVKEVVHTNSIVKSMNSQSEAEIEAVKNTDWSELRSPEKMKQLTENLMLKINPKLQCPGSAVLCPEERMFFIGPDDSGKFKISGYVDSQNGFGAMRRVNFNATAHYDPKFSVWFVEKVSLYEV